MSKNWLLALPILLCMLSCEGFSTGGNPNEGITCLSQEILKVHVESLRLDMTMNCLYKKMCDVNLGFDVAKLGDSLNNKCFAGYELKLVTNDSSKVVCSEKRYPISLTYDNHLRFSLFDIDTVEKKYDIDLSGIINSYTVRGDSVDVKVMENCSLSLYECHRETVYGNRMLDSKYSFSILEGCKKYYSYDCTWPNQGPLNKDTLDIHAKIYWKE